LEEANLSDADLCGANLHYAHLSEANLSHADLTNANLSMATLVGANLSARLVGANLSGADLTGANVSTAILSMTVFGDSTLSEVKGLDHCRHLGPSTVDFQTLKNSGRLPIAFLRGVGLPDSVIDYFLPTASTLTCKARVCAAGSPCTICP
jgi:uncharacterized protein YjbI with pentapeptide repeats